MLKYLIIQLDDTSTSYCHYGNLRKDHRLISLENLKAVILFAMKENLTVQFVYPKYELPEEYKEAIRSIDHSKIVPMGSKEKGDVVVLEGWEELDGCSLLPDIAYVLRTGKKELFDNYTQIPDILPRVARLNVVITDVETFEEKDFFTYKKVLATLSKEVESLYAKGLSPQLNLLTDRMMLDGMNNCNAGWESITLAPDGRFYVCPAFYLADEDEDYGLGKSKYSIGDLENGLDIKNPQLYKLSHAPLCRNCDAYQCKRCVWLNRKMTYEVNTPSHEQCMMAHLERNASRELLMAIRKHGTFLPGMDIKEISYLDPFDVRKEW
ncbi:MAG: CXXX repeat peptide maturase [Bacteroidaceae bacterium]|nr:CXXX repeat peptide maturase [Bacteroidaceae bacterium]